MVQDFVAKYKMAISSGEFYIRGAYDCTLLPPGGKRLEIRFWWLGPFFNISLHPTKKLFSTF
jgi:hypothetical protein